MVKKKICLQCRRPGFCPWVRKILWRREQQPTPVSLPGEPNGQRGLAGYSPWGCKESDTTKDWAQPWIYVYTYAHKPQRYYRFSSTPQSKHHNIHVYVYMKFLNTNSFKKKWLHVTRTGHTVCPNEFHLTPSWHQAVKFTWSKIKYRYKYIHRLYLLTYTYICIYCCCLTAKSCPTLLQPHGQQPARLLSPWDSQGKITGVGCHALLQRIFPTQGLNPHLLH